MKKVLLTGATGLIGKETIQPLLDAGFEVYAVSSRNQNSNIVNCLESNLFNIDEVKNIFKKVQPEYLLHFAWCASGDYLTSDDNYKFLDASLNMLKVFKEYGGKRAVFAGTCFEYEFIEEPLKETDKLNPQTIYAKCKNELREKAEEYCETNDISFGWGRIFYVYGQNENEKRLTAHLLKSLKNNQEVVINNGDLIRDYIYTKDIAGAFVKFLKTDVRGCVNMCTGAGISLKDYANLIAKRLGKQNLVVIKHDLTNQPKVIVGDNSRLLNEVEYVIQYTLEEALDEILDEL